MKNLMSWVSFAIVFGLMGSVYADCGDCKSEKGDAAKCSASECESECSGCPIAKAMEALPQLTYTVEGKTTCCEYAAIGIAKENETHMHYVVGDKEFDAKEKAMVALADVTEKFVSDFATPHTCSKSGKTTVCGASLGCSKSAAAVALIAKEAMEAVTLTYRVGDEDCSCPNKAKALAASKGAKKEFVIGDASTCCEVDARIKLAHAKYRAALEALAKAHQKADTLSDTLSSTSQS